MITNNDSVIETVFTNNIEEFMLVFQTQKINLVKFLVRNFRENIHYVIVKKIISHQAVVDITI
jgi:hypothetical protein